MSGAYSTFEEMVAAQKQSNAASRAEQRAAWVANMDLVASTAVPIRARLVTLLNEARRHERSRATTLYPDDASAATAVLLRAHHTHIDQGYRNLLSDVTKRCDSITKANAPAAQMWTIGTEAIGCFSSMLPWSDGIANRDSAVDVAAVAAATAASAPSITSSFRVAPRPPQMMTRVVGGMMGIPAIRIQHRDPAAVSPVVISPPAPRWTVPTRLNVDNRKLAATVASRRRVLQRVNSNSCAASCGAQMQSSGQAERVAMRGTATAVAA